MRGKPLIQGALFALVWLLLLVPIRYVTRAVEAQPVARHTRDAEERVEKVWLSLRFSGRPDFFEITQEGRSLWRVEDVVDQFHEETIDVLFDAFGVELGLSANFPEKDVAVEIAIEASGRDRQSRTLWVSGEVDEVVTFSRGRDE